MIDPPDAWASMPLSRVASVNPDADPVPLDPTLEVAFVDHDGSASPSARLEIRRSADLPAHAVPVVTGDVLVDRSVTSGGTVRAAVVPDLAGAMGFTSPAFHVVRPGAGIPPHWLRQVLRWHASSAPVSAQWSADAIRAICVKLPATALRRTKLARLFDEIDGAEAGNQKVGTALSLLESSIFNRLFGDPQTNPKRWPKATLGDLVESDVEKGVPLRFTRAGQPAREGGSAVLTAAAVGEYGLLLEESRALDTHTSATTAPLAKGDVLFVWLGGTTQVGRTSLVEKRYDRVRHSDRIWRLRPKAGIDACFLEALLSTPHVRRRVREQREPIKPVGSHISAQSLFGIPVFLPDSPVQRRFARIRWAITAARAQQESLSAQLNAFRSSLAARLLVGSSATDALSLDAQPLAEAAAAQLSTNRTIWSKLSPRQKEIWIACLTQHQAFGVEDVITTTGAGAISNREYVLVTLDLLVSLGVIIRTGPRSVDRWRPPDTTRDLEAL